ncbi:sarcosine oxidase subunit gamma family protein [Arthrobacter sp. Br18]|uniref:sarcosine oxidase subunit gamma n=1 Tax=Arthrobacter sp. Br18 TaxID=1312954 RepID=UPI0004AC80E0
MFPQLMAALGDLPGAVVDLSANRTTLELSGPSARGVLEKLCAADLHPRSLPVHSAVSTQLGLVPVVLWRIAAQTYRVMPRASFAEYAARLLLDGMIEFASPEVL